ncbi:MAG: hypothetical protein JSV08_09675 [Acidobacteriota bacterium]|nr:MAG: hypothetical protein JSV08_09675 [Acidobacteriota bacterium]
MKLFFLVVATLPWLACGYHTYLVPIPAKVHQGEPLPVRLAVQVTDSSKGHPMFFSVFSGRSAESITEYMIEYFKRTRLFSEVDDAFPAEVELYVDVAELRPKTKETPLLSRENTIEIYLLASYESSSRFFPALSVSGEAAGFGRVATQEPLSVGHYQQAMSEALQKMAHSLYRELEPQFVALSADMRSRAAERDAPALLVQEPDDAEEKEGWEEVEPVRVIKSKPEP